MKLLLLMLIGYYSPLFTDNSLPLVLPQTHQSLSVDVTENELFDFEKDAHDDSDFFIADTSDQSSSRLTRVKNWFIDQYQYFFLCSFIFYLDMKDRNQQYWMSFKNRLYQWSVVLKKYTKCLY